MGTLDVISFYRYSTLEPLLLTKHKPEGFRIYKTLGEKLFHPFMQEFVEYDDRDIYIVGIDEDVKSGYSHVAQLTHAMKMKGVTPLYGVLRARNKVNYSGKSLEYRLKNPRDFFYRGKSDIDVILVDDIMTTGITLQEAQKVLHIHGINILFAITLADVDN
ncbi:MAG: ComF family protein [Sulfurovum sp.]|nr:ComF family protein [Sulfurovum sp.]MCB4748324.1 ComF family protein [Sulfurovum sp.]MCB4752913.1 ComF family protein [Sulfurovum sp.]MCB4759374.1 ComF family protein [Sulfurovum sp.]MCB4761334.1 ComF family protein [Sulfurovum sp.]